MQFYDQTKRERLEERRALCTLRERWPLLVAVVVDRWALATRADEGHSVDLDVPDHLERAASLPLPGGSCRMPKQRRGLHRGHHGHGPNLSH